MILIAYVIRFQYKLCITSVCNNCDWILNNIIVQTLEQEVSSLFLKLIGTNGKLKVVKERVIMIMWAIKNL